METLTYNYGETPEEVICNRFFEWQDANAYQGDRIHSHSSFITSDTDSTDLLTVLDALKRTSVQERRKIRTGGPTEAQTRFGQLRISILAALGIEEG